MTQMTLPLRDRQAIKDKKLKFIERHQLKEARRADRKTIWSALGLVFGLYVMPLGGMAAFDQIHDKPIYDAQHTMALRLNGKLTTGSIPCMTEYNFAAGKRLSVCAFPRRGMITKTTSVADMLPWEKRLYDDLHHQACEMADGREGYDRACAGLDVKIGSVSPRLRHS